MRCESLARLSTAPAGPLRTGPSGHADGVRHCGRLWRRPRRASGVRLSSRAARHRMLPLECGREAAAMPSASGSGASAPARRGTPDRRQSGLGQSKRPPQGRPSAKWGWQVPCFRASGEACSMVPTRSMLPQAEAWHRPTGTDPLAPTHWHRPTGTDPAGPWGRSELRHRKRQLGSRFKIALWYSRSALLHSRTSARAGNAQNRPPIRSHTPPRPPAGKASSFRIVETDSADSVFRTSVRAKDGMNSKETRRVSFCGKRRAAMRSAHDVAKRCPGLRPLCRQLPRLPRLSAAYRGTARP